MSLYVISLNNFILKKYLQPRLKSSETSEIYEPQKCPVNKKGIASLVLESTTLQQAAGYQTT